MQYRAYTVCAEWQDGPTYPYGSVYADGIADFSKQLAAHLAECDRVRRGIAYVRVLIGTQDEQRLTRAEVEEQYLPRKEDCPWCNGEGYAYHDEEDGIPYGISFPCQRCNTNGWIEVLPVALAADDATADPAMSEIETDHPEALYEGDDLPF